MNKANLFDGSKAPTWRARDLRALLLIGVCALAAHAGAAHAQDLLRMSDQFDKMDKGDFDVSIAKANQCTAARDFNCTETQLRAARKLANDSKSKNTLKRAEDGVLAEKARVKEEERVIAQRQRDLEQQQERQRLAEQRARDAEYQAQREADERANLNSRVAAAGNAYAQSLQAQANSRAQDQARSRQFEQRQAEANAAAAREQRAQQQRQSDNQRLQLAQAQQAQPVQQPTRVVAPVAAPAPATPERVQAAPVKKPSNSINTGREAMRCVSVVREKEDLAFNNTCNIQIFVVWCGDLKYSNKHCGDGPPGNSFYTHSTNVMPGDKQYARGVGNYHYAACEGGIAFGKDEIQDRPDGTFTCVPK